MVHIKKYRWQRKRGMKMNISNQERNDNNNNLHEQIKDLETILFASTLIKETLHRANTAGIKNYYIGAGCIAQTVWNYQFQKPLEYGIKDIDFVYYDNQSLDYEAEDQIINKLKELYKDFPVDIDVKNQARVHLWYRDRFGYEIEPYDSLESAINTWPTTATAIGVKLGRDNIFEVYAPYGLSDLFHKIVRPNKVQITENVYNNKVSAWLKKWPELTVVPW